MLDTWPRIDLLKKRRSQWGLKSARGQAHTIASIGPAIERVRARFPKQGSHDMRQTLIHEEKITVSRYVFFIQISVLTHSILGKESWFFATWIYTIRQMFKLARVDAWRGVFTGPQASMIFGYLINMTSGADFSSSCMLRSSHFQDAYFGSRSGGPTVTPVLFVDGTVILYKPLVVSMTISLHLPTETWFY